MMGKSTKTPTIRPVPKIILVYFEDSSSNVADEKIELSSYIIRTIIIAVLNIMIVAAEEKSNVTLQFSELSTRLEYYTIWNVSSMKELK